MEFAQSTQFMSDKVYSTYALVTVSNNGTANATDLIIIINPAHEILKGAPVQNSEFAQPEQPGTRSIVIKISRLTPGDYFSYSLVTGSSIEEEEYGVSVTFNEGEKIGYDTAKEGKKYLQGYPDKKFMVA